MLIENIGKQVKFTKNGKVMVGTIKDVEDVYAGMNEGYIYVYKVKIDGVKRIYYVPIKECEILEG